MSYITEKDIEKLNEKGYIIVKNFYNINEINKMRQIILYNMKIKKNMLITGQNSGSKPDFLRDKDYSNLVSLLNLNEMHKLMASIFQAPFHLCYHNDIGLNRVVDWHKDTLNNQYKVYQKTNIWQTYENEKHEIYKFLVYLQHHNKDNSGLHLIEGSHKEPTINIDNSRYKYIGKELNIGDVVIFDQRITHRGKYAEHNNRNYNNNYDRILISIGFGKNNIFTKEFEEGTIRRQNEQNKMIRIR